MDRSREQVVDRFSRWLGRSRWIGAIRVRRGAAFPDRWSLLTGRIVAASFAICMVTGVIVLLVYDPSIATVAYDGVYAPLAASRCPGRWTRPFDCRSRWAADCSCGSCITGVRR